MDVDPPILRRLAERLNEADQSKRGWITSGFMSKHLGTNKRFNEDNTGLGYKSADGLLAGVYRNSNDRNSAYLAKEFATDPLYGLRATLTAGAATGYSKPVMPVVMPGLLWGNQDNEIALGYVPKVGNVNPATLAVQFRKRLK